MTAAEFSNSAAEQGLSSLLIGGHAVMVHGHPRNTFDWDLLIPRSQAGAWQAFALGRRFRLHQEGPTFMQFDPPDDATLPLDLMIVSDETFEKFRRSSLSARAVDANVRVVCLKHLIALKCHAVRHGHAGRVEKDVDDVIALVRVNRIDLAEPEWRQVFQKHGPPRMYEKVLQSQSESGH